MPLSGRSLALLGLVAVAVIIGSVALTGGDGPDAAGGSIDVGAVDSLPNASISTGPLPSTAPPAPTIAPPALPDRGLHPELRDIDGWLQSDIESLEELEGQVVAVQFWTFACSNCKATLPHMQQLYADYHDQGFEIVGVHAPEFAFEADVDNVAEAAVDLGVTWPIALDTNKRTFHLWQEGPRAFWPRVYLLDREGHIRYDHTGEGSYEEIDAAVQALLAEPVS